MKKSLGHLFTFFYEIIPKICVWVGLFGAFHWTLVHYFNDGNFADLKTLYFSMIGVSAALSGISFSYARTYDDQQRDAIRKMGEAYLYSALNLICTLIIVWIAFMGKGYYVNQSAEHIFTFIFSLSLIFAINATTSMHYGITKTMSRLKPLLYSDFDWITKDDFIK